MRIAGVCVALLSVGWASVAWSQSYRPPRLSDGRPDLQGTWNLSNLTPLERMRGFDRLEISSEEAAAVEANIAGQRRNQPTGGHADVFDEVRTVEPVRGVFRSSIIVDPNDGMIPGNALFRQKVAEFRATSNTAHDGPEQRAAPERCLASPAALPPMQGVPTLNFHQIVQTPQSILIVSEWNHDARVVRMNGKPAPASITSWLGDSVGRWDGDTLVVETRNFAPTSEIRSTALVLYFVSPQSVVTERFTLVGPNELYYEFTVEDPTFYVRSWRGENRLVRTNERILEFACHEGNYAIEFILRAARSREAR